TMRLVDLGIAIGSAVKTASILNVDNRVMFTVGRAAQNLKLIDGDVVFGIPISIRGSNIFFDRYDPLKAQWQEKLPPRGR
ncbi:MAG: ferredoxin domain-containing protein, partial [Candidatus Bathyarchaeia archaeon]